MSATKIMSFGEEAMREAIILINIATNECTEKDLLILHGMGLIPTGIFEYAKTIKKVT